jgi:protein-disulfide isomerase
MRSICFCLLLSTVVLACASARKPEVAAAPAIPQAQPEPVSLAAPAAEPAESDVERIYTIAMPEESPTRGPRDAKVTLQVCSDFECPFCSRLEPTLAEVVENYGELVRVVWRHCPLPFHQHAMPAAEASTEVYAQAGDAGFWAYHDVLFAHQTELGSDQLIEYARKIEGVDVSKVAAALADHRHVERIARDLRAIADSGAASRGFGTPATFINGRLLSGAQPYEAFEIAVERALQETPEAYAAAKQKSELAYPMARVRHVLVQYNGSKGAEPAIVRSKEEAFQIAQKLHDQIALEHKDMAEIAKAHSDCPSSERGGELGRFTRGELVPEFERALFSLAPGQISNVVETPFGYHVISREE